MLCLKLYILEHKQRQIVLETIKEVCSCSYRKYRKWVLLAAHVRTNHVHLVVHAILPPEKIMNTIKSYSSRNLNKSTLDGNRAIGDLDRLGREAPNIFGKMKT